MGFHGIGRKQCNKTATKGYVISVAVCFSLNEAMPYFHIEDLLLSRCVFRATVTYWECPFGGDTRSFAGAQDDKGEARMIIGDRMTL